MESVYLIRYQQMDISATAMQATGKKAVWKIWKEYGLMDNFE